MHGNKNLNQYSQAVDQVPLSVGATDVLVLGCELGPHLLTFHWARSRITED